MSRILTRTLRGRAALTAVVDYLAPADGNWGSPDSLRGGRVRNAYANHQAMLAFLAELEICGARCVHLGKQESDIKVEPLPISAARFRPMKGDPDIDGDEGTFGFGDMRVSLDGIRMRMSAPGVIGMADRWGDSVAFGATVDAPFAETRWEPDEWDLDQPGPPVQSDHWCPDQRGRPEKSPE